MLPVRHCVRYLGKHLTPPVRHAVRWSTPAHYSPHLTRYERAMKGSTVAFIMHLFAHSRCLPLSSTVRSEEHTSDLQSLMRTSSAVFCLTTNITHDTSSYITHPPHDSYTQ